jgi:CelD/BcsL family acetyltransferase involved in cellulose biosynthesis
MMAFETRPDADGLESEWWDLWRRDPAATPFQSPAWLMPWRRYFDEGESLVLTAREGGRLMALLPLFTLGGRLLPWGAATSDRLDGLFDPNLDPAELSEGLAALDRPLDLFQLQPASPLLQAPLPTGWHERRSDSECCVRANLPAEIEAKLAENVRYYRRRAARAGADEPSVNHPASIEDLADLHTRLWRSRALPGVFADQRFLAWQQEALPALEAAGLARLYEVRIGGYVAAALYILTAKGRAYYYIGGFDPEHASLGLGSILVGHAIEEAEKEGLRTFDFLRGRERYKYRWGGADCPTYARYLAPPGEMVR